MVEFLRCTAHLQKDKMMPVQKIHWILVIVFEVSYEVDEIHLVQLINDAIA